MTFEELMKDEKQREKVQEQLSFLNAKELSGLKDNPLISKEMLDMLRSLKASVPNAMKENEGMHRVGMIGGLERLNYFKTMPESVASYVNYNGPKIQNELAPHLEEMKNPSFAASQIAGSIVKEAYGVQPVFVTNWPEASDDSALSGGFLDKLLDSTINAAVFMGLQKLFNTLKTVATAGAAATTRFIPRVIFGPPEMYQEKFFGTRNQIAQKDGGDERGGLLSAFAGLDLFAQFRGLKPNLGGLNYLAEILSPASAYAGDNLGQGYADGGLSIRKFLPALPGIGVAKEMMGFFPMISANAFAYDTATLTGIGNYHGDSMRGLTDSAPETLAPQIKVTVNQPPIQNKVNMLKVKSGLRWIRGLALKFSDTVFECLDFFFHGVFGSRRWNSGLPAIGR